METIRINAIIYPDKAARDKIIEISKKCSDFAETKFTLDDENYFPHITIYFPNYPLAAVPDIKKTLNKVITQTKAFKINFSNTTLTVDDGGIFAKYEQTSELMRLRDSIISTLNPLRDGLIRTKYKDDLTGDSIKFGYPINKYHFPHVTLTCFTNPDKSSEFIQRHKQVILPNMNIDTIAISEMGENGTCVRIIDKFKLVA